MVPAAGRRAFCGRRELRLGCRRYISRPQLRVKTMRTTDMSHVVAWQSVPRTDRAGMASAALLRSASVVMQYGLAAIILWFGVFKFTPTEAQAIQPLVANSPILSWLYALTGVRGASRLIGCVEIVIAVLIMLRSVSWRASAVGGI